MTELEQNTTVSDTKKKGGFQAEQTAKYGGGPRTYRAVASELVPGGLNRRFWDTEANRKMVRKTANSIWKRTIIEGDPLNGGKLIKSGVNEPLRAVQNGSGEPFLIDSGETRWRAVRLLEGFDEQTRENVPAVVAPDVITFDIFFTEGKKTTVRERRFQVALSNEQRPFTDLEWAAWIKDCMDDGVPQDEIAHEVGQDPSWVHRINKLNDAPESVLPLLREGQVRSTTWIEHTTLHGPERAAELILVSLETGKGEAAEDYEEAMAEIRAAEAEKQDLNASGTGNEPASADPRAPSKIVAVQRRINDASERAKKAKRAKVHGPARITSRAIAETASARKATENTPTEKDRNKGRVDRTAYADLHDAVDYAARHSKEEVIREKMNAALKRCGYEPVPYEDEAETSQTPETPADTSAVA